MKKEKFQKKLNINKKTIANLSEDKLDALRGGFTGSYLDCCDGTFPLTGCPLTNCGNSRDIPCAC
ncbi:MAG: hypothetical protein GY950_16480 [bacterium]|nr:hypothetical protein [bacterium]